MNLDTKVSREKCQPKNKTGPQCKTSQTIYEKFSSAVAKFEIVSKRSKSFWIVLSCKLNEETKILRYLHPAPIPKHCVFNTCQIERLSMTRFGARLCKPRRAITVRLGEAGSFCEILSPAK